jgi:hypothetical protein
MDEHRIMDALTTVRDEFPLFDRIGHERDIVNRGALGTGELSVLVQLKDPTDIPHKCGMTEAKAFYILPLDEGYRITSNDIIASL